MKYNLTNETYIPETLSNFPGAPKMSLWNMISVSIFYNWIPIIISLILYYPIVNGLKKLNLPKNSQLILTAIILTLTTPVFYIIMSNGKHNDYYQFTAELIAWALCFISSIGFYYLANNQTKKIRNFKK